MVDSEQQEPQTVYTQDADKEFLTQKSIVMVGLMGAGKSAIGRRLATQLDMPFIDADTEIETAAGCSIEEIFERHGEEAFRDGERRVIARLLEDPPVVMATGGGAFMDETTRTLVTKFGISVWLRADLDTLVRRTANRNNRPLLKSGDPVKTLKSLMVIRHPIYELSDITVESYDAPLEETVNRVCASLYAYLTNTSHNGMQ
ncbi:MAG: shikimate kinase [Alphaproteobacteria bacterium]|nr:shikimate kinase [Alphaproteobacteria bacterium]